MPIDESVVSQKDQTVENLFSQALQLEPQRRTAFVEAESGSDHELRTAVVDLLECHQTNEDSGFILDEPAVPFGEVRGDSNFAEIAESVGDTIGRYRLLEKIGEGGMGVVYLAEQLEGVHRQVALKIIKLGMDTRQFVARFEAERQVMTRFSHPNIARVLDAGATQTGRPYFVMELVRGLDVVTYVKRNNLGLKKRLSLFVTICRAIQHSHQKAIVHRDLKPTNILVSMIDDEPVPKIIDFGVAKALRDRLTEKTLFTQYASIIGTPQYMSPEQAELGAADIDTRTDIYSLGVLLFELVTGETPLTREQVKILHPLALLETIRQQNIEKPSVRLAKIESEMPNETLNSRVVQHELDCIVMKAVARDRSMRYSSATELAADVQRLLDGDPVEAVAPTTFYRLRSYFRQNRKAVLAASAVAGLLMASSLICSLFAWNTYRTNLIKDQTVSKLSFALHDLTVEHQKLVAAEKVIRETAENQVYRSAVKTAVRKFHWAFYQEIRHLVPTFRQENPNLTGEPGTAVADQPQVYTQIVPHNYLDFDVLLDLERAGFFEEELDRLVACVRSLSPKKLLNGVETEIKDEIQDPALKAELTQKMIECRPKFFRILLAEYQNAIGNQDPRIACILNLLAISLLESGDFSEAEQVLRQAIEISNEDSTIAASRSMLSFVRKQQ